jgi:membrane protease YdiL (CAAX protease family)
MSGVKGPSATIESSEGAHHSPVAFGWREGVAVLTMVLAPVGLAIVLVVTGVLLLVGWQFARGMPATLPTIAELRYFGLLAYVAVSWTDVAAAWLWSSRRGWRDEVFRFRGLTWPALATAVVCFAIAMYGAPIMTQGLSRVTGGHGPASIDLHDARFVVIYVLLFAITSPLCEEILYRGLLVAWLRRIGWRDPAIWCVGSLLFGLNHAIPLGLVWATVMVLFGAILFAIRLRFDSLSPAWLTHFLFNAQPLVIYPLIAWLAPALLPGRLA